MKCNEKNKSMNHGHEKGKFYAISKILESSLTVMGIEGANLNNFNYKYCDDRKGVEGNK